MTTFLDLTSIIVVNWRSQKYLEGLLTSLQENQEVALEVILVNNSPTEDLSELPERYTDLSLSVVTPDQNLGFAGGCNRGIQLARGDKIALFNPDTTIGRGCLQTLVAALDQYEADVVCPKLLDARDSHILDRVWDGYSTKCVGVTIGKWERDSGQYDSSMEVFAPSGAAGLYRRSFFEETGLFDELLFAYYEDVDLAIRGQLAGKKTVYIPTAVVFHFGAGTTGKRYNSTTLYYSTRNLICVYLKTLPRVLQKRYRGQFLWRLMKWVVYFGLLQRLPTSVARGLYDGIRLARSQRQDKTYSPSQIAHLASWMERSTEAEKISRRNRMPQKP